MWDAGPGWDALIAGSHGVTVSASARYEDRTVALQPVSCQVSSSFESDLIRTSIQMVVADPDGSLAPRRPDDILAPYGQTVDVRLSLGVAGSVSEIPIGEFVIMDAVPSGGRAHYRGQFVPSGGTVALQLGDLLQQVVDAEIVGLVQPLTSGTVASELQRICGKLVPVDVSGVPDVSMSTRGVVYAESRIEAAQSLAALTGWTLGMGREGALTLWDPETSTPIWDVTTTAGTWVGSEMDLSRDDIYNIVIATGDTADDGSSPCGMAKETTGPFRFDGPLGPRVYRMSSPLLKSNNQANLAAETRLLNLAAKRRTTFTATTIFNPAVDVLDVHSVTLDPLGLVVDALVVGVEYSGAGGPMTLHYSTLGGS